MPEKIQKNNKSTIRLSHYLSRHGACSRREADKKIANGSATVNGEIILDPAFGVNEKSDIVTLDQMEIKKIKKHSYYALYKPEGFLSSFHKKDESGRLLGELFKIDKRLFPAGRLDLFSSGLLLLTTDGDWANKVMHPKYEKTKEYLVKIKSVSPKYAQKKMSEAYFKEQGKKYMAKSVKIDGKFLRIELSEGRYRQIRRLARSVDLEITSLIRIRIGTVTLGKLHVGGWRKLTPEEVSSFN